VGGEFQPNACILLRLRNVTVDQSGVVLVPSEKPRVVLSPRPALVREIQLINRVEEMQILREAADRTVNGQGGVVFLYGEAGIGKTRLAKELGAYARSQGLQVLSGKCPALFRMDGVPPYVLWTEVIRDYFRVCTPEQLYKVIGYYPAEVCKLVPELDEKLRVIPKSLPISPEHERNRLFEAVSQFITNISKESPLLVILDDLQWTDQSSLLLLHYLARGVYRESLLLVGAYRDTYIDKKHPLSPILKELNRERLLQSISLKRLSFDDVSAMIKRILEQEDVPREFCELVYERTRGNPFFIEEVIRSQKEEEIIYRDKNKWKIKDVCGIEFPETVKDIVKARMNRLDAECQRVLMLASFLGKDFTFEALSGVTNIQEDNLLEIMEKILRAGFIKQRVIHGEDVCSFADTIVRDVVYEEVSPFRRKKLHSVVGSALEKMYADKTDEHLGELALHFVESGDEEKALDFFLKAGEKAAKVCANSEAFSYFQSALRLLEEKEGELREKGRVLEKLGDIKMILFELEAGMKYWNEALLLWKQLHEKERVAGLHRKMANVIWGEMDDAEKAKDHYNKALKILETAPESVELARLYVNMATQISTKRPGDMAEALSWAEKGLELAKKLKAHEVIAPSYASLGGILVWTGDKKKGLECLERALKIALDNGYIQTALHAYIGLAIGLPTEEYERRLECWEKGLELAKSVGHIGGISWFSAVLARTYTEMGNVNKGLLLAEESVGLSRKSGSLIHLNLSLDSLGFAYQVLGEWNKSEQYYKEALSISQRLDDYESIERGYGWMGWFHLDKGEYVKAREFFEKMYEVCEKAGAKYAQMHASRWLIWTYIELGGIEKAKSLLDNLHKFALETRDKDSIAKADALRAMLFRAQKKWKESIEQFEQSLQEHEALNARRWNVYLFAKFVLHEYARVYLERDQEGDREKAHDLLNQALEIFQKMGAKKDVEKAKSRLTCIETGREMGEPKLVAKVPEIVLPSQIETGHKELDALLFGGIPRDYAVILTSPSCDERDSLIRTFLEAGAKEGQITFHIVTSVTSRVKSLAEHFQSNFYLFVCNPQADKIIQDKPNVFKLKGVENLTNIEIALISAFRRLDKLIKSPRRICIEIVSDVLMQHHTVQTRKWLNSLIPDLKSKGFTALAVIDPRIHAPQEFHAIVNLFEGEVNIYEKETEKGPEKFLKIKKMTNQKYSKKELSLQEEKL